MPIPRRQQAGEWLSANGKISRPISSTNYSEQSGDRQDQDSDFHLVSLNLLHALLMQGFLTTDGHR
jgi:hypothetical protein